MKKYEGNIPRARRETKTEKKEEIELLEEEEEEGIISKGAIKTMKETIQKHCEAKDRRRFKWR